MEIKASSKYDWKTIKTFYAFSFDKKNKLPTIFYIVLFVVLVATYGLQFAQGTFTSDLLPSLVIFSFLYIMVIYIRFVLPKVRYNKNKILHGVVNNLTFSETQFEISQSGDNATGVSSINYDAIYKIYETKEYIYIYITPQQAHFVDKSTIIGGTADDLRLLLTNAVGKSKYKIKCKV